MTLNVDSDEIRSIDERLALGKMGSVHRTGRDHWLLQTNWGCSCLQVERRCFPECGSRDPRQSLGSAVLGNERRETKEPT